MSGSPLRETESLSLILGETPGTGSPLEDIEGGVGAELARQPVRWLVLRAVPGK